MDPDPPHGECLCRRWLGTAAAVGRDPEAPVSAVSPPPRRRRPCRRTGAMQGAGARRPASFRRVTCREGGGRAQACCRCIHSAVTRNDKPALALAGQGCVVSTTSASACATCQRRSGGIKRCWDCNTSARPAPRLTCHRARRQLEACSSHHAASTRAHVSTSRRRFAHTTHCAGRFADEPSFGLSPAFMRSDDGAARRPAAALSCFGGWAPELCRNHEHYHWRPELSPHSWVLRGVSWPWAAGGGVAATRGLADADHEPQWPVTWPARHVCSARCSRLALRPGVGTPCG